MKPPTDLQILEKVYNYYYAEFAKYKHGSRITKLYVPIDVDLIGRALRVDGDIIFGRLHYHFNHKYSFRQRDNSLVDFFLLSLSEKGQNEKHLVRFELLASVLSEMLHEGGKRRFSNLIAAGSFVVSIVAILVAIFR